MTMRTRTTTFLTLAALAAFAGVANAATIISHYSFDTGDVFTDLGPGLNHGTAFGGASISTGVGEFTIGDGALHLDGSGDYLSIDSLLTDLPSPTADFSIAAWFRTSVASSDMIFSANFDDPSPTEGNAYLFGLASDQQILSHVGTGIGTAGVGSGGLANDSWHHGVATYKASTDTHTLYVDGVSVGPAVTTVGPVDWSAAETAQIGMERDGNSGTVGNEWNGYIDDLRIYSGELTPGQVGNLYTGVPEPSTLALGLLGLLGCGWRRRRYAVSK